MSKILKTHPKSVQSHKDLILQCLDDKDESIRLRALDLLYGMVCVPARMRVACEASVLGSLLSRLGQQPEPAAVSQWHLSRL